MRLILLFLLIPSLLFSQVPGKKKTYPLARNWYLGVTFGPDFYYGDLNPSKFLPTNSVSLAGSLFTHYHISNVFGMRFQLLAGGLKGLKTVVRNENPVDMAFTGLFIDVNANTTINFSSLFSPNNPSRRFFVYGTVGLGYAGWFSKDPNKVYPFDSIKISTFINSSFVIPAGIGAIYNISKKFQVSLEWTFRTFLSDKLDNTVSGYRYDIVDYLAIGVSINLSGKKSKKIPNLLDYPNPVSRVSYSLPPPVTNIRQPQQQYQPRPQPQQVARVSPQPDDFLYKVQICAFSQHDYSADWIRKKYRVNQPVTREQEGTMSRYLVGGFTNIQKARELRNEMVKLGIHDVFIIAYKDGIRHHSVPVE
ncbi:MAG: hypothetical protein WCK84_04585 [Bacteroidota bacterium]